MEKSSSSMLHLWSLTSDNNSITENKMLFILLLIIIQIGQTGTIETTSSVTIILDGFTLESWKEEFMWNKTGTIIVHHLNELCKNDVHCDAEYGINNLHLLDVFQHGLSSIYLNITVDKPILNKTGNIILYNYTALLTGALFQAKIDIEHLHDNQLLSTIVYSSTSFDQNSVLNRTRRLLFVLLGIVIVAIVFALTIFFFQRMHKYSYSKLLKTTPTSQQIQEELLNHSQSMSALNT